MLDALASRYPAQTFYLGQIFNDTTNSYKFAWFLGILSLLKQASGQKDFKTKDIAAEMVVAAWHSVCLYRLTLGTQDKLQNAIMEIQLASGLPASADRNQVREFMSWSLTAQAQVATFSRYVPTRFLTPWFAAELRGQRDSKKDAQIARMAYESQKGTSPSIYWLEGPLLHLNKSWQTFLIENHGIIQGFTDYSFAHYLQARNPSVPGVIKKMQAPVERELGKAKDFWRFVGRRLKERGESELFSDIYSEEPLGEVFSIDHFLPWSFVAHDLLWNLTPVAKTTNSKKGDCVPEIGLYLPRLVTLHRKAIALAASRPKELEDFTDCFKTNVANLVDLDENSLLQKYRDVLEPQAQIAINQGFESGWRFQAGNFVPEKEATQPCPVGPQVIVEFFTSDQQEAPSAGHLPFFPLKIAAGGFIAGSAPDPTGWVNVQKCGFSKRITKGMFVTQVIGESMEPTIKNGWYCVFRTPVEGSRQNRVVLIQKRDLTDPETGGNYTVKRYRSRKAIGAEGWRHESIELIPDNLDRERFPILAFSPEDECSLNAVAEFVQMLAPPG